MKYNLEDHETGCDLSAFNFVFICVGFKKNQHNFKDRK